MNEALKIFFWFFWQIGDGGNKAEDNVDAPQPKGRWAQRFDQKIVFKSQLDLTILDDDAGN